MEIILGDFKRLFSCLEISIVIFRNHRKRQINRWFTFTTNDRYRDPGTRGKNLYLILQNSLRRLEHKEYEWSFIIFQYSKFNVCFQPSYKQLLKFSLQNAKGWNGHSKLSPRLQLNMLLLPFVFWAHRLNFPINARHCFPFPSLLL